MAARLARLSLGAVTCLLVIGCGGSDTSRDTAAGGGGSPAVQGATRRALHVFGKPVSPAIHPIRGNSRTPFVVSFTAAETTGVIDSVRRGYEAYVQAPGRVGCIFDTASGGKPAEAGQRVRIVLDPRRMEGGSWCRGRFRGIVKLQVGYACPPHRNCHVPPDFPRPKPKSVGRFGFTVR
jgi:hypothetical protein